MTKNDDSNKIAKTRLAEVVAEKTGLPKHKAKDAVDAVIDAAIAALRSGKSVGLPGLGTLSVKATSARTGVRPGTTEKISIPAGKKVSFKAASTLKDTL